MISTIKPLLDLTAGDLMSSDVTMIPKAMSLRSAAHLLSEMSISGAPVVDQRGRCVGVLSATDFMHSVGYGGPCAGKTSFDHPDCYHSPWQIDCKEELPEDEVSKYMTADPVMVPPSASIADLARQMTDAHIHRIIVVDGLQRPIGVVSSTDILAAVAHAEKQHP